MRFLIRILSTALGLWVASKLLAGFAVNGGIEGYILATIVLVLLNLLLKPILKLVSFPFILLSLGLFTLVINAVILWLASEFVGFITIDNLYTLLWASIIVSVANLLVPKSKQPTR